MGTAVLQNSKSHITGAKMIAAFALLIKLHEHWCQGECFVFINCFTLSYRESLGEPVHSPYLYKTFPPLFLIFIAEGWIGISMVLVTSAPAQLQLLKMAGGFLPQFA